MKKKKQRSAAVALAAADNPSYVDLRGVIHEHSLFFDRLIDLIPPKFYLSNDDGDSKPWFQGLSKAAKASLKQQSKQNLKLARRNRLDPEKNNQSSTLHLLQQKKSDDQDSKSTFEVEDAGIVNLDGDDKNNSNVTYEELRQKLRRKIESLRGNRGSGEEKKHDKKGSGKVESSAKSGADFSEKKRKRRDGDGESSGKGSNLGKLEGRIEKEIKFGKVKIGGDEEETRRNKKKRKLPKEKELERAKKLEEVKKENPALAERESWKVATNRAMGVKVHDDPKLLKESIKKEKRRRQKHAEKWKERVQSTQKLKQERQQKRRDNISGKIHEKKMRKIAKREKKLMRPGFEGRKEG